ncbi:MAG: phosphonate ABC transporter ATP-binding protein [Xanthobacteraceae bacterium]
MQKFVLRLEHVSVVYPNGVCALDGASLAFERGLFVALLGPSGAGKSTLLRSLNGLVRPSRGEVLGGDNQSIFAGGPALRHHRRQTAMIFQQHHLIGRLTALQNVLIGRLAFHSPLRSLLPPSRAERRRALEALDRVELLERALSRADQLSGGEQQRVGIARALVQGPRTILADEPVASLDPATASRVLELIRRICREDNITVIASLHQVELARHFASRVIGLSSGRIVFDGPTGQLTAPALQRIYGTAEPQPAAAATSRRPTEESGHESPSPAVSRRRSDTRHRHLRSGAG